MEGVFVAKKEIESWFVVGRIVRDMGIIFINREKRRDIPRAGEEIIKKLNDGEGVVVSQPGTVANTDELLPMSRRSWPDPSAALRR